MMVYPLDFRNGDHASIEGGIQSAERVVPSCHPIRAIQNPEINPKHCETRVTAGGNGQISRRLIPPSCAMGPKR
jgi:hypothetical protein